MMRISTKKGDTGYTSTLSGDKIPKFHIVTEAVGAVDEANSLLGLARASTEIKRIKLILFQVQKHLFVIGAELSVLGERERPLKNTISETDIKWLEVLVEDWEEALALPPGFVAFGQKENASHLDVARTGIRKAERMIARMAGEGLIKNDYLLKYLNRLSDLIFLLACMEEKQEEEKRKISKTLFSAQLRDPQVRKIAMLGGLIILALICTIIIVLIFHGYDPELYSSNLKKHLGSMSNMHETGN
jgi:cob(I)alamin adenosyltransferase